ncbi:uncharacterized protein LOC111710084 [Eurytemora carolleeae]|uniref:uncharacterized protein LOC111710084 n=1 Tax=Eurytemora carolleeae TaxID=1294199 RepID=UPI000C781432|nr:uncharacterized protein LOC111710084 [Eurytemora carolleeae]|eukprot:XP_023339876.1 uncharacterized protein LOC111710084 [Eurytemora affinis]
MFGNMGVDTTLHQSMNPPISWVPMMILLMNARQGKGADISVDQEEDNISFPLEPENSIFDPSISFNNCDPHYDRCVPDKNLDPHPCSRTCKVGEAKTCYYEFIVEWYSVLGKACFECPLNITDCYRPHCVAGDGVERGVITVNRQLPGTPISVCSGDKVVVDVVNKLPVETTTMHWHGQYMHGDIEGEEEIGYVGLENNNRVLGWIDGWGMGGWRPKNKRPLPRNIRRRNTVSRRIKNPTPWSDGVPGVNQCPILPRQTFRYKFIANPAGTHWYHAHAAFQREDGNYGKLIVRVPDVENLHRSLYDEDLDDHVMIVQDWVHKTGVDQFIPHHWDDGSNKPESFLINGKGRFKNFGINVVPGLFTPVEQFSVEQGKKYRFRIINAGVSMCPVEMSIEGHKMLVIATDGMDIKPVLADSLVSHNGERYDIVIDTSGNQIKPYKIKFGGLFDCGAKGVHGTALLVYKGSSDKQIKDVFKDGETKYSEYINIKGVQVNSLNVNSGEFENKLTVTDLRSMTKVPGMDGEADRTIFLAYSFYDLNNPDFHHQGFFIHHKYTCSPFQVLFRYFNAKKLEEIKYTRTPQINNITMMSPVSPMLTQYKDVYADMVCNSDNLNQKKHCKEGFCHCYHVEKFKVGDIVDMFLIDEGLPWDVSHPFHLHGLHFQVLSMERFAAEPDHIFGSSPPGNSIRKLFFSKYFFNLKKKYL